MAHGAFELVLSRGGETHQKAEQQLSLAVFVVSGVSVAAFFIAEHAEQWKFDCIRFYSDPRPFM